MTQLPYSTSLRPASFAVGLLLINLAFLALSAAAQPVSPASAEEQDKVVRLEKFTVTGSNISRQENEKALPVTIINRDTLEARDASTPVEFLGSLPQVVNVPLNESSNAGAGARGDNSAVSLRGLSTGNTLLLLNGRRLAPHPISQAEGSVPSLSPSVNQLPNRGIERIEVLRDGASSVYGSDAVAGVINYLTDRNFRGSEIVVRYGYNDQGSGDERRVTALFGRDFASGRGRFVTTFDLFDRDAISTANRSFSAVGDHTSRAPAPWNDVLADADFFFLNGTSVFGNFATGTISPAGVFTPVRPAGVPSTLVSTAGNFFFVPNGAGGVAFKTTAPNRTGVERDYYYNRNANFAIQPESRRFSLFTSAEFDLKPELTAFLDFNYYNAHSVGTRDPDSAVRTTDGDIIIPDTNPFNPFGARFFSPTGAPNADGTLRLTGTPSPVVIVNKRFPDTGARTFTVDSNVLRLVAGLKGRMFDSWRWESAVLYTKAGTTDIEKGTTRESLFQNALTQTDPARAYNPFNYNFAVQGGTIVVTGPATNAAGVLASFAEDFRRDGDTSIASWDFRTSGDLLSIWGGNTIGAAAGLEYRYESYDDARPPFHGLNPAGSGLDPLDNDFLALSPNSDTHADRRVAAGYIEVNAPLIGPKNTLPLVKSLELSASARYENYSDFGTTTKPKFSGTWKPFDGMVVRGSYNESFRAPNLAQLFTGELIRSNNQTDTYRLTATGLPSDGNVSRLFKRAGNQNLQPEEGKGKSVGVVVDVPWIKGLSFSVDYWEIRQAGAISTSGGVTDDTNALLAATQAALAAGQNIGSIDLGSGTANYQGNASVLRNPVTQADRDAFAAFNATRPAASQRATVGTIAFINETFFNRAVRFVNGVDFDLSYRFPKTRLGSFLASTEWTYLIDAHDYAIAGAVRDDLRWQAGAPIWKGNTTFTWRRGNWRAGLSASYTGDYQDATGSTTQAVYESLGRPDYIAETLDTGALRYRYIVDSLITFNAYVSYRFPKSDRWFGDTSVRLGAINLTNEEPPLAADLLGYTANQYNSIARGRVLSIEVARRF
jgi:outer membrane receptor protein involved in Fe transport